MSPYGFSYGDAVRSGVLYSDTAGLITLTEEDDGYAWPVRSACRSGAAAVRRLMLVETVGRVTWGSEGRAPSLPTMGATLSRATVSHLSGTGSLIVWIFAQTPYVIALTQSIVHKLRD